MAPGDRRVVWSESAESALDDAIAFIAEESPNAARDVLDRVLRTAASLATLSGRGGRVSEADDPATRQLLADPYRLIYRVEDDRVTILAILHQRQDVALWSRERRQ